MSLLIDALRRAEQARLESELQGPSAAEGNGALRLAPLEPTMPAEPPALAPLGPPAMPAAMGENHALHSPSATPGVAPRAAARKLFEAKQAPPRRLFLPLVGGFTTLAVVILGGYLWWELQPRGLVTASSSGPGGVLAGTRPSAPPIEPPVAPPAPTEAPATSQTASHFPVFPEASPPPRREPPPARGSFAPPLAESPAASGLGTIQKGKAEADTLPAALSDAYAAYNAGDLGRAFGLYREVLRQDPHNRDALNGLGAIALRQGKEFEAEAWFRRSLAADPGDPVAQAGLTTLRARSQPEQGESRMKSLVAAQPQAAPGHFALGNALAAQNRWPEAQQAYFEAHSLDPENPDYLFNLAVSLDRLHQTDLARRFYAEALAAAGRRVASFEPGAAEARLQALSEPR